MKYKLLLSACICALSTHIMAQSQPLFSGRETIDIRVATPELFAKTNQIELHLDSLGEHQYAFPLQGARVISNYGSRQGHSGVDLKTYAKDTIRCAFDGVVRLSKVYAAYGNVVVVRHASGLETVYSHNYANLVKSGEVIKAGQPLGLTGRTGRATTEHLHLETRINGQHFNPNLIFDMKQGTIKRTRLYVNKSERGIVVK